MDLAHRKITYDMLKKLKSPGRFTQQNMVIVTEKLLCTKLAKNYLP